MKRSVGKHKKKKTFDGSGGGGGCGGGGIGQRVPLLAGVVRAAERTVLHGRHPPSREQLPPPSSRARRWGETVQKGYAFHGAAASSSLAFPPRRLAAYL